MQKVVAKYHSFKEAEEADLDFYRSLSGQKRLEMLLDLIQHGKSFYEATEEFKRVYRIIKLPRH